MSSTEDQGDNTSSTAAEKLLDHEGNVEYWANRWGEEKIGFHKKIVNPILQKFLQQLTDGSPKRFFVPLCGKSLDLIYLHKEGHEVFAVEAVKKAIEDLDTENTIGLQFNEAESTYSTDDGKLKVYLGDIFECPIEKFGPFDCVWDRGSFIALEFPFRSEYVKMMQRSVLSPRATGGDGGSQYHNFRYLMETVDYDRSNFGGPPRAVDEKDMDEFFGDWTDIKVVLREPDLDGNVRRVPNIGPKVDSVVYFLTPKPTTS